MTLVSILCFFYWQPQPQGKFIPGSSWEGLFLQKCDRGCLEDGTVIVEPENVELSDLRGILKPKRKGVSISDMDKAIRAEAVKG